MSFSDKKRKPSMMAGICRMLFNYGKDLGLLSDNPFENLRIGKPPARTAVWKAETIQCAINTANELKMPSVGLAIQMALDTGQRAGDLRLLTWSNYNGVTIKFRQSKTNVWIEVPVMKSLQKMLDMTDKQSPTILINEATKKPYNKDLLCRKFREVCEKAEIGSDLQFRDLRRTAVVRLAEHGCTNAEIAAITGHSIERTSSILDVYLPRNSKMAANAIAKMEKLETNLV
ncbi:MAG: tyrosine-type recombinase/integrase [Pseudomonadota bacterium]